MRWTTRSISEASVETWCSLYRSFITQSKSCSPAIDTFVSLNGLPGRGTQTLIPRTTMHFPSFTCWTCPLTIKIGQGNTMRYLNESPECQLYYLLTIQEQPDWRFLPLHAILIAWEAERDWRVVEAWALVGFLLCFLVEAFSFWEPRPRLVKIRNTNSLSRSLRVILFKVLPTFTAQF